jgi:hypothetical protein
MRTWLLVVIVAAVAACKSPSSDGASAAADASLMRLVTDADCNQWADHGTDVIVTGFAEASRGCSDKVRDDVSAKFVARRTSLRDGAMATCKAHQNQPYRAVDGACYLAAKSPRELASCKLKPMTAEGDSDWAQLVDDLRARCGSNTGPTSPPPGPML